MTQGRLGPLLDERLLRLFDALYATRNVSQAAALLGQAQPTVSIWLGRLRRELNDPLFVRSAAGMDPTPRAQALIGTVRSAIDTLRQLSTVPAAYDPATDRRRFSICMTDASHIALLPQILAEMRQAAPHSSMEARRIDQATGACLQAGEADLALGLIPSLEDGFYQQVLYHQDWVCLASPDHPRVRRRLTRLAYEREAHVGIVSGTGQALLKAALARHGVLRRIVLELPGFLGLAAIIRQTDLLVTLPRHIGETLAAANGLRTHTVPFSIASFVIKQHWHARYHHDPANRWLRGLCARLFQRPEGPTGGPTRDNRLAFDPLLE